MNAFYCKTTKKFWNRVKLELFSNDSNEYAGQKIETFKWQTEKDFDAAKSFKYFLDLNP